MTPGFLHQCRSGGAVVAVQTLLVGLREALLARLVFQKRKGITGLRVGQIGSRTARGRAARTTLALSHAAEFLLDLLASLSQLDRKLFPFLLGFGAAISSVVIGKLFFP